MQPAPCAHAAVCPTCQARTNPRTGMPGGPLTPGQRATLQLLAEGHTQHAVARRAGIHPDTLRSQIARLRVLHGAPTLTALIAAALRAKEIQ